MIELIDIKLVKENKDNPRTISDSKFDQLVKSIKEFPQMLEIRPIVVNKQMVVLGGNMRLKACKKAGLKTIHIIKAEKLTKKQQQEFIIKDNISFGLWDSIKMEEWDIDLINSWGLDSYEIDTNVNLEEFFEDKNEDIKNDINKIIFEFNEKDFNQVNDLLNQHKESKEQLLLKLLQQ